MASRDFIITPNAINMRVSLEPAYAMLLSLSMLTAVDDYPGMDDWLSRTAKRLSKHQMHNNELVFDAFGNFYFGYDESWPSMAAFMEHFARLDPSDVQAKALDNILHWCEKKAEKLEGLEPCDAVRVLDDKDYFITVMNRLHYEEHENSEDLLNDWYTLLHNPPAIQQLILEHVQEMWDEVVAEEWERTRPMLEESVEAFQSIDFSDMDPMEAAKIVTGRDLKETFLDEMPDSRELIFVPTPHIGPYVGYNRGKTVLRLLFRHRLPEGVQAKSAALGRSELLVRLSALADDTRLRILELFTAHEELCAPDVIRLLDLSQSAASRHLRHLTASGYLTERRHEGAKCYSLNSRRVEDTLQALRSFLLN